MKLITKNGGARIDTDRPIDRNDKIVITGCVLVTVAWCAIVIYPLLSMAYQSVQIA
jgi:hypothetical protein